jgi:hypothetical protein
VSRRAPQLREFAGADASSWPAPSLTMVAGAVLTPQEFSDVDAVRFSVRRRQ